MLIGFIIFVIGIGYLLYFLFLKPAIPGSTPIANINGQPGVLPGAGGNVNIPTAGNVGVLPGAGGPTGNINIGPPPAVSPNASKISPTANGSLTQTVALTADKAYQPTLADGNNVAYYNKTTGLFYKVTPDGRTTPLNSQIFYDVEKISWAPNKNKAILEYPDGSKILYDFTTNQQTTLPKHWKDFSFAASSNQVVFKSMGTSADSSWLAVANADGSKAKKIEPLGDKDGTVHPNWSPNGQIVAMYTEDLDFNRQELFFVGANNENLKSTIIEGRGFDGQWSTNGDRLLYSVYSSTSGYRPTLWIVEAVGDSIGQNRINLGIETWSDKCSFAGNDKVYCAVPQNLSEGSGIFTSELDDSPCDIYSIDLKTGFKSKVAIPEGSQNIESVMVTNDGRYLYFNSKTDGRLYKINLK